MLWVAVPTVLVTGVMYYHVFTTAVAFITALLSVSVEALLSPPAIPPFVCWPCLGQKNPRTHKTSFQATLLQSWHPFTAFSNVTGAKVCPLP